MAEKERWKEGERGRQKSTIKDNERGRDELCIGVTGGQEETNLEGRRCQIDTSSIHLYSDLLYLSHSSAKINSLTEEESKRAKEKAEDDFQKN